MTSITQQPAALSFTGVSGDPFTLTLNVDVTDAGGTAIPWSEITNPTVTVVTGRGAGTPLSGGVPTVTSPSSGVLLVSWSAAQTPLLPSASWALSLTINGVGPYAVCAGTIAMTPPTQPGTSSTSGSTLAVAVGTSTATVSVVIGGAQGPPGVVQAVTATDATITIGGTTADPTVGVTPDTFLPLTGGTMTGPILFPVVATNTMTVPQFTAAVSGATQPAPFASHFISQTFGGVLETSWSIGYNPDYQTAGETAGYLKFLPNCGDTPGGALEIEFTANFPDGHQTIPLQITATRSNTHALSITCKIGAVSTDVFQVMDDASHVYFKAGQTAVNGGPGVAFGQPISTPLASQLGANTLTFGPLAAGGPDGIFFHTSAGSGVWRLYMPDADGYALYLRDDTNGVMLMTFYPSSGNNGQIQAGGVIYPVRAATASAPTYAEGGLYFDTTLNKDRVGGVAAWETVLSYVATGTAVLSAGTIAVANAAITAASKIHVFVQAPGGTVGAPFVSVITAGTGFTIASTSSTDTSTIAYEIESY